MKNKLSVCLKRLLPLAFMVFMISGCELLQLAGGVADIAKATSDMKNELTAPARAREAKLRAREFGKGGNSPSDGPVENRLARRTSTLAGGIPVDVSPYLLHEKSFTVTENGIQHSKSILEISEVYAIGDREAFILFEFDVAVTLEADKQKHQMNATVALCDNSEKGAKNYVNKHMKEYAAQRLGLDLKNIKNFRVRFLKTRKSKKPFQFLFTNVFVQDIEPCYFQFDAEVEYQKKRNISRGKERDAQPDDFAVLNKVYRSDFTSLAAAVVDVQTQIWNEARSSGYKGTQLPVINFVKSVKVTK